MGELSDLATQLFLDGRGVDADVVAAAVAFIDGLRAQLAEVTKEREEAMGKRGTQYLVDEIHDLHEKLAAVTKERDEAKADLEQREVQLAGCGVAALGGIKDPALKGQYGWSASYGDVLALRLKYETAVEALEEIRIIAGDHDDARLESTAEVALAAIRAPEEKPECTCEPLSICGADPTPEDPNCPRHGVIAK